MWTKIDKNIKKAISVTIALIVILSIALVVQISSSSYIKMFNFKDKSTSKKDTHKSDNKCLEATVTNDKFINLGDFLFVLADNRKLEANISFKYKKINDNSSGIFKIEDSIEDEIKAKSSILRDRVISVMFASPMTTIDNKKMKQEIIVTLNKNLTTIKVEEIYFNKFIMY
ncbi:flagellar basal body-associated FliL family protein [Sulfurimonas sp.]|uniref:flagellar basal body-associated FliL family protein n=1 Tax=Sulfurimonas sp. TaxID=2022749 RepID=UPI00260A062F|nr:flagellar basal body-associated FliL family protein [Sulfurimonas sp.]MDD5157096.1 flagellar basal body-associated FliL family protein [Sulfurimonas sp.]